MNQANYTKQFWICRTKATDQHIQQIKTLLRKKLERLTQKMWPITNRIKFF